MASPILAQAPQGIHFQAVARNASGIPLSNTSVTVRFEILDGGGTVVYDETHGTITDNFGLFKLVVGQGTPLAGTFSNINWGGSQHQIRTSVNGTQLGTTAFESVPYALYAENAADGIWDQTGTAAHYDAGRVAIGLDTPKTTLHLADTSNFLIGEDLTGSGFKMIYYAAKGAFRVGFLNNPFGGYNYDRFWDYDSVGYYSFAGGRNSRAKGFGSFAFGNFGWADGTGSVAFFGQAKGNNSYTFGGSSIGRGSFTVEGVAEEEGGIAMYGYTGGRYGVSIGGGTTGLGASSSREDYAIAIGWNSDARGQASIALGPSDAYGYNSFSTGWVTEARGNYSSTFGYQTNSYPYASMALGRYNVISGDSAAWVNGDPIFMIGDGTSNGNRSNSFMIQKNGQTAIGYNAPTGMLQVSSALGSLNNGGALDPTHATLLLGTAASGMAFDPNQIEGIGSTLHLNFNSNRDVALVNGGGDVAIGHQAPAAKLDVASDGWQLRLNNEDPGGDDWFLGSSASFWTVGAGKFVISPTNSSSNSEFVIEPDGQVGMGTLTPNSRLQVDADAGEDALRVRVGGLTRMVVNSNGGVAIGQNVTPPVEGLYVSGESRFDDDAFPDNDNTFDLGTPTNRWRIVWAANGTIQTSDRRDKTQIANLTYGLEEVLKLRPVSYEWEEQPEMGLKIGLIAQELQEVVPEVVVQGGEDPAARLGVNYAELVPVLIQAMQEQQAEIEALKQERAAMQSQQSKVLAQLEARLKALESASNPASK
ncbi:MAG: tail fiber domain-containing protein [Bacteroidota bacterium]